MKISDVLWLAANEHLWSGSDCDFDTPGCSCDALLDAGARISGERHGMSDLDVRTEMFLRELGLDVEGVPYGTQFDDFASCVQRQGARYLWLDFARLVAEDEGL